MKQILTTVFPIFLLLLLSSCGDNAINDSNDTTPEKEQVEIQAEVIDSLRLKSPNTQTLSEPTTQAINGDDYQIIFRDIYSDYFYLNPINSNSTPGYYGYIGKWKYKNVIYDVGVVYNKSTKSWSGVFEFISDMKFVYHMDYRSYNYYTGAYSYANFGSYPKKTRRMTAYFTKGSFPGMNN